MRADGICERCKNKAPFKGINDKLFLEVHHIHRLADDGPDIPKNVIALCPNCHREAHYGSDFIEIKKKLIKIVSQKEESYELVSR